MSVAWFPRPVAPIVPTHAPAALRALPLDADAAALALATVNGEEWATLTEALKDRYRNTAILAALLVDPKDCTMVAYLVEGEMSREFERWTAADRRDEMARLMRAIREAAVVVSGVKPKVLAARRWLMDGDDRAPKGRVLI